MNIRVVEISSSVLSFLARSLESLSDDRGVRLRTELESMASGETSSILLTTETTAQVRMDDALRVRDLVIDPRRHEVTRAGQTVDLTAKEFEILHFLARNRGDVFTKEEIYNAVWNGKYYLDDSNIMAFIRKLRKKLEPDPDDPVYILTIWGVGYKFAES